MLNASKKDAPRLATLGITVKVEWGQPTLSEYTLAIVIYGSLSLYTTFGEVVSELAETTTQGTIVTLNS